MGALVVQSLRHVTRLPLETHLMITNPDFFFEEFVKAGSDSFLVHWEGNCNLNRTVRQIKELGKRAGVAINPATPASGSRRSCRWWIGAGDGSGFGHQHFHRRPWRVSACGR
jgi:pentose-5-phosphate-3-epimerase